MTLRLLDKLFTKETLLRSTLYGTKEFAALDPSRILAIKVSYQNKGSLQIVSKNIPLLIYSLCLVEFKSEKEKENITRTRKHKYKKLSKIPIVRFLYIVFATIVKTQPYMGSTLTLDLYKKPCCCPSLFTILLTCNFLFVSAEVTRAFSYQCRKGRYEWAKKFCVHLHAIFCKGGYCQEQTTSTSTQTSTSFIANPLPSASSASPLLLQRMKTMELNSNCHFPYDFISPELLHAIDACNAISWCSLLHPTASACGLCGHNLGNQIKHPGSEGQAYLVTSARPYSKVEAQIKLCRRETCRAIHQVHPSGIGEC